MRERAGIAALVLFVAVDVLLVSLAFRHTGQTPPPPPHASRGTAQSGSGAGADAQPPSSDASPRTSQAAGTLVTGRAADPFLAVARDGTVLRATRGSCRGHLRPMVQVARPGRARLEPTRVEGLAQVVGVRASDTVTLVGLDAGCALTTYTSDDDGTTWASAEGGAGSWHLPPRPRASLVVGPSGAHPAPCRALALSPVDEGVARLLCSDGVVKGTSDGGAGWITLGQLVGAVDLAYQTPGDGVAVAVLDDCDAAVMRTADGGTTWDQASCLTGGQAVAVATAGDRVVAMAGDRLQLSTDGGRTWRRLRG